VRCGAESKRRALGNDFSSEFAICSCYQIGFCHCAAVRQTQVTNLCTDLDLGLVEVTSAVMKKWLSSRTVRYNFVSIENTSLSQECVIYSPPFEWTAPPHSPLKCCDSASQKQAKAAKCLANPCFHDNLYQAQLSGFSALPESRRQSLPHPYSTLRANTFLRISRNRVQANNPHLNKSFGMNLKGGPEPLEKEIHKILGSKRVDRFSDPFLKIGTNNFRFVFSYLLHYCNLCKDPRTLRKFPQKCQKIAGC